jgi:proteasome assembly chaperone (PAC2) family protein
VTVNVDEVLTTAFDEMYALGPLHAPIMVVALRGWFDVAEVATGALDELLNDRVAPVIASIDPDPFYDFTQERPEVYLDDDDERHVRWPSNEFRLMRNPGRAHDLVVLSGVEPHLRFATFADSIITVARRLGCSVVVTVGAAAEAVPHTRPPLVVGSSTTDGLVRALGLSRPTYQGITGLVGVLQQRLDAAGIPAVSLRVGVPHYLGNARHPKSSVALLQHLEHVLDVPTGHARFADDIARWRLLHDEAVADDRQAALYLTMLEAEYDRRAEASMPTGEDLAADFERFLREQGEQGEQGGGTTGDTP